MFANNLIFSAQWCAHATLVILQGGVQLLLRPLLVIWPFFRKNALSPCVHNLWRIRQSSTGRHMSNGAGAVVSLVTARSIVFIGPRIGSILITPLRFLWVSFGTSDLRVLLLVLILTLLGILRFYKRMGLFD
mmetsp:Transcript_69547/g.137923  ORF Transcript_69547/g.137923 Transcript_69547/m.137923 type:complete len:132 (-) Transcript_69547:254-649(-)